MENFAQEMHERGGHVILCGVKVELMRVLREYGLIDLLGPANIFEARGAIFESAQQALARARELAEVSIDTRPLEAKIREEALTYEI